jgi:hypothetical protein
MPTDKRPKYKEKLLEISASPPNMIIKMGTYRRQWVPTELFDNPSSSHDKLAWVICIDQHKATERSMGGDLEHRFIPVREVRVVKAKTEGENLLLWLETKGYLCCDDYDKCKQELIRKIPSLPPGERRFIALDVDVSDIASIKVLDAAQYDTTNECWRKLAGGFANMAVYSDAIFYRIVGISKNKSYLEMRDGLGPDDPIRFYQVTANETHYLEVYYWLPEAQFDLCPQDLMVSADGWLKIYDQCTMDDRIGTLRIPLRATTADPFPYEQSIGLTVALRPGQLTGPSIKLPIRFLPERLRRRLRRGLKRIALFIILAASFFFGLTLQEWLPGTGPYYGAAISTIAVVLIPLLVQRVLAKDR